MIKQEIFDIFPKKYKDQRRMFLLLKDAYLGARYWENYSINKKELEFLSKHVSKLRDLIQKLCLEYIEKIENN